MKFVRRKFLELVVGAAAPTPAQVLHCNILTPC